jgi:hypothetical protein
MGHGTHERNLTHFPTQKYISLHKGFANKWKVKYRIAD